jgi:hypothetical protein
MLHGDTNILKDFLNTPTVLTTVHMEKKNPTNMACSRLLGYGFDCVLQHHVLSIYCSFVRELWSFFSIFSLPLGSLENAKEGGRCVL